MSRRALNPSFSIVTNNGLMERQFIDWQLLVTKVLPMNGNGSPEGVVEADQYQHYYDDAGAAGSILYIKMLTDVGGDKKQGWKLS